MIAEAYMSKREPREGPHMGWRGGRMYEGLRKIDYTLVGWMDAVGLESVPRTITGQHVREACTQGVSGRHHGRRR